MISWMAYHPDDIQKQLDKIEKNGKEYQICHHHQQFYSIGDHIRRQGLMELFYTHSQHILKRHSSRRYICRQNICEDYLSELVEFLTRETIQIIVISKSGTTTEPAIAFRI